MTTAVTFARPPADDAAPAAEAVPTPEADPRTRTLRRIVDALGPDQVAAMAADLRDRIARLEADAARPVALDSRRVGVRGWFAGTLADLRVARWLAAFADQLEAVASGEPPPPWPDRSETIAPAAADLCGVFARTCPDPVAAALDCAEIAAERAEIELASVREDLDPMVLRWFSVASVETFEIHDVAAVEREGELLARIARLRDFAERFPALVGAAVAHVVDDRAIAAGLAQAAAKRLPPLDADPELLALCADRDAATAHALAVERQAADAGMTLPDTLRDRRVKPIEEAIAKRREQLAADRQEIVHIATEGFLPVLAAARNGDGEALWNILEAATRYTAAFPDRLADQLREAIATALRTAGPATFAELFE
jgi:hypothetical protein